MHAFTAQFYQVVQKCSRGEVTDFILDICADHF